MPSFRSNQPLDNDLLMKYAPSIFTTAKSEARGKMYKPVPTIDVIEGLRREGFFPVAVAQSKSRSTDGSLFARHMLRFRQSFDTVKVGSEVPEIVYTNSHDGTSTSHLMAGIYRLVCSNGMIAGHSFHDARVRHTGDAVGATIEGMYSVVSQFEALQGQIEQFKSVELNDKEAEALANSALIARYGEDHKPVTAGQLIQPYRLADKGKDLWSRVNVIQEHMLKGGVHGRASTGRRTTTRAIAAITEDVKVNRAIWTLGEEMFKLKTA